METLQSLKPDHQLIEAIRDNRVSLFLGAGAAVGAVSLQNASHKIPNAQELAKLLSTKFLGGKLDDEEFRYIYDLCCSREGVRSVQKFIHEVLIEYGPSPSHLVIPKFAWSLIFTTNYDLIIERAYEKQADRLQELEVLSWDPEGGNRITASR